MGILEIFNLAHQQGIISVDVTMDKRKATLVTLKNNTTGAQEEMIFPYAVETDTWYNITPIIHWADVVQRVKELGWLG